MRKYPRAGQWPAVLCLLIPALPYAQSAEELLAAEDYPAAAEAFSARATRTGFIAAGDAWQQTGDFGRARRAYERAVRPTPDSLGALAQHKIGVAYYNDYQDSLAALAYHEAIRLRDAVYSGPVAQRAHSRLNLAQIVQAQGRADSASILLREAIDIYARAVPTDSLNWMRALNSLVELAEDDRDVQVATDAARQAEAILRRLAAPDPYEAFNTYYTAGKAYYALQQLAAAERSAAEALRLAETIGEPLEKIQSYNLLGSIYARKEAYEKSIAFQLRGLELAEANGVGGTDAGLLHFNLARRYGKVGRPERALFHQRRALTLLAGEPLYVARLQAVAGEIFRTDGEFAEALRAFDRGIAALPTVATHFVAGEPTAAELEVYANLLDDRADALARLGRNDDARAVYPLLFAVQDDLRGRFTSDESRRYRSRNLRPLFDRAIALEYAAFRDAPDPAVAWRAFTFSERAKAYSLLTARQRDRNAVPARESALRARIAALERSLAPDDSRLAAARLELDRLLRRQTDRDTVSIPPLDRDDLLRLLRTDSTQLIAYHVARDSVYRFDLTPAGDLGFTAITGAGTLPKRVNDWRAALRQSAYRSKSLRPAGEQQQLDRAFLEGGARLRTDLLGGLRLVKGGRICVLPDGPLALLPFAALPLSADYSLPLDYGKVGFLIDETTPHYAYSARSWRENVRAEPLDYELDLLAFAPTFNGGKSPSKVSRTARFRQGERALTGLAPLVFNRAEVEEIARLVPRSEAFVAEGANRVNFLDNLGRACIVHLSTHSLVNTTAPELSFVAFSQRGDSLEYAEMLYFNDLSALHVRSELAVLSACETALGAYVPGETTLSLASAFMAAGARSTLTTLWQVDDAATRDLMVGFYTRLAAGNGRSEALAEAMRAHGASADFAHPYYWSATTLYGAAGPVDLWQKPWIVRPGFFLFVVGLAMCSLVVWGWFIRRK